MAEGDGTKLLAGRPEPAEGLIDELRGFLRDLAEKNKIPRGKEEHGRGELIQALRFSLDDWNSTPPLERLTFDTHPSLNLLLHGAAVYALEGAGIVQSRNEFNYSDGGIQVRVSDKTPLYQSWINNFLRLYEQRKRELKASRNIEGGYGGSVSPYAGL